MPQRGTPVLGVDDLKHRLSHQLGRCVAKLLGAEFVDREHHAPGIHGEVHGWIVIVEGTVACLTFLQGGRSTLALR